MNPDYHGHVCEWCGCVFTHAKSLIAKGFGHQAHQCPACWKQVNQRVEIPYLSGLTVQFHDWYGHLNGKVDQGGE